MDFSRNGAADCDEFVVMNMRVAVRRGAGDGGRRQHAIGAGLVLDHDRLAEPRRKIVADEARGDVDAAAGGKRQDQRDGTGRIILRGGGRTSLIDAARSQSRMASGNADA